MPEKAVEQFLAQVVEPDESALLQEVLVIADHLFLPLAADFALAELELGQQILGFELFPGRIEYGDVEGVDLRAESVVQGVPRQVHGQCPARPDRKSVV